MISVKSGMMTIPKEDRFVGFAGDNAVSSKTFLIEDEPAEADIYRLFLTFDDAACNYFELEETDEEEKKILLWNIKEDHLFKPGLVRAQIKAFSSKGEIWHSSSDCFIVEESAEFSEYFSNKENSEFLSYERRLMSLKSEIENLRSKLPYIGPDGCWYIYQESTQSFVRMDIAFSGMNLAYEVSNRNAFSEVPKGQLFTCQGSIVLKTGDSASGYEELSRTRSVCPVTRTVAGLPLSSDISVSSLKAALGLGRGS